MIDNDEKSYDEFLDQFGKNKRITGYKNYLPLIKRLINYKVWPIIIDIRSNKTLKKIAQLFKIDYSTIKYWNTMLRLDREWMPNHKRRGIFTRVFTPEQFETLIYFEKCFCDSQELIITNKLIHDIMITYYNHLNYHPCPKLLFNTSDKFVIHLKKIIDYSSRRFHLKRRPDHSVILILIHLTRLKSIGYNCDETFWRTADLRLSIWAQKGSDNIFIDNNNNNKDGFSVLTSVVANGQKLSPVLIAEGKTTRVEANWFGSGRTILHTSKNLELLPNPYLKQSKSQRCQKTLINPDFFTDHSEKGWSNNETFSCYLKFLRNKCFPAKGNLFSRENRIYLIADTYPHFFILYSKAFGFEH